MKEEEISRSPVVTSLHPLTVVNVVWLLTRSRAFTNFETRSTGQAMTHSGCSNCCTLAIEPTFFNLSFLFLKKILFIYLFIYLWLCWVFVSVRGLSLVVANGGHSSSRCAGLSLSRPLLLRSTGSRRTGSVIVAHGSSCSAACGIFLDQGSNLCPLH